MNCDLVICYYYILDIPVGLGDTLHPDWMVNDFDLEIGDFCTSGDSMRYRIPDKSGEVCCFGDLINSRTPNRFGDISKGNCSFGDLLSSCTPDPSGDSCKVNISGVSQLSTVTFTGVSQLFSMRSSPLIIVYVVFKILHGRFRKRLWDFTGVIPHGSRSRADSERSS